MISLGLHAADQAALLKTLGQSHRARSLVTVSDLSGNTVASLTKHLDDGQVNFDATQTISRSLQATFNDPGRALPFDTDSPADTALYFDRQVRVERGVLVGSTWRDIPVFTGPITALSRPGDQVVVTASGKEVWFTGAAWRPFTLHKGMRKTDAIRYILQHGNPFYSEQHISIPTLSGVLPSAIAVARDTNLWVLATSIASSMGMQLFYDGAGVCRLRYRPTRPLLTFAAGSVVTRPQITYSSNVVNAAYVQGGKPKGAKGPVSALAIAPASHPLSPKRIGRVLLPGGKVTTDSSIMTKAEALARAEQLVKVGLLQSVQVAFEALPNPLFDPLDVGEVHADDIGAVVFPIISSSLPLGTTQNMTVGYTKSVSTVPHVKLQTATFAAKRK